MVMVHAGLPASLYTAVITIGTAQYTFDAVNAFDLGTYQGAFVQQRCLRVVRPDTALAVYFRPDVTLDRLEVVVELGRCWLTGTNLQAAHITTPYTCEIFYQGNSVATVSVPYHWWWARWRWQSAPRPVVQSTADLLAQKLIPPFGQSGLYGAPTTSAPVLWTGPMDTADLSTYMAAPGDRPEIGLFTEAQAEYLISGSSNSLATMLTEAEACGTMPIHWRDEHTGSMINVYQYPTLSADSGGVPQLPAAPTPLIPAGQPNAGQTDPRYFLVEQSHTPPLPYLPYLLTDDPYYLEELEALATMAICRNSYHRVNYNLPGVVYLGETRAFAWSMRSLFQLGKVSSATPPAWLHLQTYWQHCIIDNHRVMQLYMQSPSRLQRIFRAFTISNMISSWQNCYVGIVLANAVYMGYTEWTSSMNWFFVGITKLCDGTSGWNRQMPTPYYYYPYRLGQTSGVIALVSGTSLDTETDGSWSQAWADFKKDSNINDSGWDGHSLILAASGPTYFLYLRGTLALAAQVGVPEAQSCYNYIATQLPAAMSGYNANGNARWSLDPPTV